MNRSESIDQLAVALAKAQAEITSAVKQSENLYFNTHYADLAAVWTAARPGLTKNGLSVSQFAETEILDGAGTIVSLTTMLLHSSGQWLAGQLRIVPAKTDAQSIGSCFTYMRRYALAAITGVVTEDDDGNAAAGASATKAATDRKAEPPKQKPADATKLDQLREQALELPDLVARICALGKLDPNAVIGSYFKTKSGQVLGWDEVRGFHSAEQFRWVIRRVPAIRKQYQDLLAQHPEGASQERDDVPL
jgi:hypothetical protein